MSAQADKFLGGIKRYPIPVCSAVLCLVLLGGIYLRGGLIAEKQSEVDTHSAQAALQRSNMTNAATLQEQLAYLVEANGAVRDRAFVVDRIGQDFQYFYPLAAEAGVRYLREPSAGQKQAAAKGAAYVPLAYTIEVQGTFPQIITYIKLLEQGLYFCRINSAVFGSVDPEVTLTLNVDFLGVQKGATK